MRKMVVAAAILLVGPLAVPVGAKPFRSCADYKRVRLARCTSFVLSDDMPGDDYYESGSRSATSPGFLGLDEDQDEAEGILVSVDHNVLLDSFDVALWFRGGTNELDVFLVEERQRTLAHNELYEPNDGAVLEHWSLVNRAPSSLAATGNVVHVESVSHPRLLAGQRYWLYMSVPQPATGIAWISQSFEVQGWFGERNSATGFVWFTDDQPAFALRVHALH